MSEKEKSTVTVMPSKATYENGYFIEVEDEASCQRIAITQAELDEILRQASKFRTE